MNSTITQEATSELTASPSGPGDLVAAAIAAADYANKGAPFDPFLIKFADPTKFVNGWSAQRGNAITFYGEYGGDSTNFSPLGDFAAVNSTAIQKTPIMLLAPMQGREDALARPTGFTWILDDAGSRNSNDIAYFWPTAPDGYQALGICVGFNGKSPDPSNYWCIKTEYLQYTPTQEFWSDSGSHWTEHNGNLSVPSLAGQSVQNDKFLLAPTTMLSDEHGDLPNTSWCLVLTKLMLPVAGADVPFPVYDPHNADGTKTSPGLGNVAVLPSIMVNDPAAVSSPFYYLAAEPSWFCIRTFSSPEGASITQSFTVGSSQSSSTGFQHTTSLEVGAEVGIEVGSYSAKASVKYTDEMQLSGSISTTTDSQTTTSLTTPIPKADIAQLWQRLTDFVVYRTSGNVMSVVTFETSDSHVTDSNPK
ncbi:Vps62-related protein [Arthrobacter sp. HLT1-20]